ncbi:MAG: alpha/beta fold hydrolase [Nanoarchaeota archaeon]
MLRSLVKALGGLGYKEKDDFWYLHLNPKKHPVKGIVVFSHGYRATPKVYYKFLDALSERGYEVFALNRNLLKSPKPRTPWGHSAETGKFIDVMGLDEFHVVGHSLGGYISITNPFYSKENPPISSTAISPAIRLSDPIPLLMLKAAKLSVYDSLDVSQELIRSYLKNGRINGAISDPNGKEIYDDSLEAISVIEGSLDNLLDPELLLGHETVESIRRYVANLPKVGVTIAGNILVSPLESYLTAWAIRHIDYERQNKEHPDHPIGIVPTYIIQAFNDEFFPFDKVVAQLGKYSGVIVDPRYGRGHSMPARYPTESATLTDIFISHIIDSKRTGNDSNFKSYLSKSL